MGNQGITFYAKGRVESKPTVKVNGEWNIIEFEVCSRWKSGGKVPKDKFAKIKVQVFHGNKTVPQSAIVAKSLQVGDTVFIEGNMASREYEYQGQTKVGTNYNVEEIAILGRVGGNKSQAATPPPPPPPPPPAEPEVSDDELPF